MGRSAFFITFEGIEGTGKSLQIIRLAEALRVASVPVLTTLEPGGTPFGRQLRSVLLDSHGPARTPVAELLLYLADRCQHLEEVVIPALAEGTTVLSDRYHDATLAYQGHARGIGLEKALQMGDLLGIRKPDLTLLLDLPVEVGLERARSRNHEAGSRLGRFEEESLEFHRRVREGYLLLASREPDRIQVVDGSGRVEEVADRVRQTVKERLGL